VPHSRRLPEDVPEAAGRSTWARWPRLAPYFLRVCAALSNYSSSTYAASGVRWPGGQGCKEGLGPAPSDGLSIQARAKSIQKHFCELELISQRPELAAKAAGLAVSRRSGSSRDRTRAVTPPVDCCACPTIEVDISRRSSRPNRSLELRPKNEIGWHVTLSRIISLGTTSIRNQYSTLGNAHDTA